MRLVPYCPLDVASGPAADETSLPRREQWSLAVGGVASQRFSGFGRLASTKGCPRRRRRDDDAAIPQTIDTRNEGGHRPRGLGDGGPRRAVPCGGALRGSIGIAAARGRSIVEQGQGHGPGRRTQKQSKSGAEGAPPLTKRERLVAHGGPVDLGVPLCRDAFTPSTRVVSRNDGSGWFLFRF